MKKLYTISNNNVQRTPVVKNKALRKLCTTIFMIVCGVLTHLNNIYAATPPGSLSITGTAVEESGSSIPMKLVGSVYELYTSLKTGNYSFEGDNSIVLQSITVTETVAPYRIRVDYSGETPIVDVKKIIRVTVWAPWNKFTAGELAYVGNSTFEVKGISQTNASWGDNRYRIKIFLEGDLEETYQPDENVENPDESTPLSYYDLYFGPNGDWPNGAKEYKVFNKYRNTGLLFNVEVSFKTDANYTHRVTDYVPELVIADNLSISGTALESGPATLQKKDNGVFEFVGGLQAGDFTISGEKDGTPYFYTLDNNQIIEGNAGIPITGALKPYYIKVDLVNGSCVLQEVAATYLFMSAGGFEGSDRISLNYVGNGKFQGATPTLNWPTPGWAPGGDGRYKFKMDLANSTSVFWGSSVYDNVTPPDGETEGNYYQVYSVNNTDFDYAFKFQNATKGQQLSVGLEFNSNGTFSHKYVVNGTLPVKVLDFNVFFANDRINLVWHTIDEIGFKEFEVERSVDGILYQLVSNVPGNNFPGIHVYKVNDEFTGNIGTVYYRLKIVDMDGAISYSNIKAITLPGLDNNVFKVYQTQNNDLHVVYPLVKTNAQIRVFNIQGQVLDTVNIQNGEFRSIINISSYEKGVYTLLFTDEKNSFRAKLIR